jgi:hypothetical protein
VQELRLKIGEEDAMARGIFEERLLGAGYLDAHAARYAHLGYAVRGMDFYRVHGAFPRIGRGDVRLGIISATYIIQLSNCSAFKMTDSELDHLIQGDPA